MLAKNYITNVLPVLHPYDSVESTLLWMNVLGERQLAVVDRSLYIGFVDYNTLEQNRTGTLDSILKFMPPTNDVFVYETQHVFDAIKLANETGITMMPVIDNDQKYLGTIGCHEFVKLFAELSNVNEPGDILVLEIFVYDYMLSKIVYIIEENNSKVLNLYTSPVTEDKTILVNIKISNNATGAIIANLERMEYRVLYSFSDQTLLDDNKDHFDGLMMFLNT